MSDFVLRTRLGAPIFTTDDKGRALSEAYRLRDTYPGAYVVEVFTPPPIERRIWTDRQEKAGNVTPFVRRTA